MPATYTNRKNITYTLYRSVTKKGKPRYYFARASTKGTPCESIPRGYEISESPNGLVSLVKTRPKLIRQSEVDVVQRLIDKHPLTSNYRIFVRNDRIDIYERVGLHSDELIDLFRKQGVGSRAAYKEIQEWWDSVSRFTPELRFILYDQEARTYRAERMCYLGGINGWMEVGPIDKLEVLAKEMIPRLGTDSFFELY